MSAFLDQMRQFSTTLDQSCITRFDANSMFARFGNGTKCTSGHIFGGNVAFLLALRACSKKGIGANSQVWNFDCTFKAPAPSNERFNVRHVDGEFKATCCELVFANAKIEESGTNEQISPNFRVSFNGQNDHFKKNDLVLNLPKTDNWQERLYYLTAACDWGIWVMGQTYYPDATFVSGTLSFSVKELLPTGNLTLKLSAAFPSAKGDRTTLVVNVHDYTDRIVASASATLVNFDYQSKTPIALPKAYYPAGLL